MTRDEFLTELQARGWGRFDDPSLLRYLDWGLAYTMAHGGFGNISPSTVGGTITAGETVTTIAPSSSAIGKVLSVSILAASLSVSSRIFPVDDDYGYNNILPAAKIIAAGGVAVERGQPSLYWYEGKDELLYLWPCADQDYSVDARVLSGGITFGGNIQNPLGEELDMAVLYATEAVCQKRAHNPEGAAISTSFAREEIDSWAAFFEGQRDEITDRIKPFVIG